MKNKKSKKATVRNAKTKPVIKGQSGLFRKKATAPVATAKPVKKSRGELFENKKGKEAVPVTVPEPIKKRRGGLRDYSEAQAETVQQVRAEFLSDTFKARMTIAINSLTFNTACVNLFPNCQYVTIGIDMQKLRLIVEPSVPYAKNSFKFAYFRNDRNAPRVSSIKLFGPKLFEFMKWDTSAKYRILVDYQEFGDKKVMVFNLDESLQVFSEVTVLEDGKKKRSTTTQMPLDWKERFGHTISEFAEKRRLDISNDLFILNPNTGETNEKKSDIEPKPPTAEELILQQYGGIRPRKKDPKKNE